MKSSSETCFHVDRVDCAIPRDITRTHSVQTIDNEDIEVVCDLHSTAALSTQMLHTMCNHKPMNINDITSSKPKPHRSWSKQRLLHFETDSNTKLIIDLKQTTIHSKITELNNSFGAEQALPLTGLDWS